MRVLLDQEIGVCNEQAAVFGVISCVGENVATVAFVEAFVVARIYGAAVRA